MKLGNSEKPKIAKTIAIAALMTGILCVVVALIQGRGQREAENLLKNLAKKPRVRTVSEDGTVSEEGLSSNEISDENAEATFIDFESLNEINPDIKAWLTIPGTRIDYPVLCATEEEGNDYYLKKNYKKEKDDHGSLYIETGDDPSFDDRVTIIYGHNMRDGSMFGVLYGLLRMPGMYSHKIYIYTPDGRIKEGELMACYETGTDNIRTSFNGLRDVQDIWEYVKTFENRTDGCAELEKEVINRESNIVTLSTCSTGGKGRVLAQYAVRAEGVKH